MNVGATTPVCWNEAERKRALSVVGKSVRVVSRSLTIGTNELPDSGVYKFSGVPIYEGSLVTFKYTVDSTDVDQKFILPNAGVDTSLISVLVKNNENSSTSVKYSNQDSLFDIGGDSKVYFLQEISDERYELFFGDGIFGRALEEGNYVTVNYIASNGDSGNGISSFQFSGRLTYTRNSQTYTVTSGISLLTTGLSSSGGDTIESVESIRKYAPRIYASQNRALTANDYETLIPARIYPETESISVFGGEELVPPQYGKVFISIKPRTGDFLPNIIKHNIKNKLKRFAGAGIVPEILDLKYLYIEVDSKVYYNSNMAPSAALVSTVVQNNANKYAESSELNKYGARFKYSKFLKVVDDSHESVTSNITTLRMRRDLRVVLNGFAEYQIGFGNRFQVKDPDGFNIKTSAFRIDGIPQDIYMSDRPRPDRESGSLFFFSLPSVGSQQPTIIRRNVGFIDYVNGVITMNPVNIQGGLVKDGQTIIEIEATPSSNDVIGLQDLYIQLDTNNVTINSVNDRLSSGYDISGSDYIVSSSFANGSLVRGTVDSRVIATQTPRTSSPVTTTTSTTTTTTSRSTSSPTYSY